MQAGEKLKEFVREFDPFDERQTPTDDQLIDIIELFLELNKGLLLRFSSDVRMMPVSDEHGTATAFEVSLKVPARDGSYLHVVVFGHNSDDSLVDTNISVIEHLPGGNYQTGHLYSFSYGNVVRSDLGLDQTDDPDEQRTHFSLFTLHESRDFLRELEQSEDPEEVRVALETRAQLDDDEKNLDLAEQMGYNVQPVDKEEIEKLVLLLFDAESFPPSMFPHAGNDSIY
ncbi:MAG: hypothetical protein ABIP50_02730 [Candidatus Saccharimonadales bacterium]